MSATTATTLYDQITATLAASGVAYRIHEHAPSVTIQDADTNLDFPVDQLMKTIAFRVKNRGWVLAALCGYAQVDYKRLAAAVGVSRDKLMRLEPEEVQGELGYELGGVAPFAPNDADRSPDRRRRAGLAGDLLRHRPHRPHARN